jgi:hypothetical protein
MAKQVARAVVVLVNMLAQLVLLLAVQVKA